MVIVERAGIGTILHLISAAVGRNKSINALAEFMPPNPRIYVREEWEERETLDLFSRSFDFKADKVFSNLGERQIERLIKSMSAEGSKSANASTEDFVYLSIIEEFMEGFSERKDSIQKLMGLSESPEEIWDDFLCAEQEYLKEYIEDAEALYEASVAACDAGIGELETRT